MNKKAILLLSGGLDSATNAAIIRKQGYEVYCLSFHYGQKHGIELQSAKNIFKANKFKQHKIINLQELGQMGGSALTDEKVDVPKEKLNLKVPLTYVPARNIIFLSYALAFGEVLGVYNIFAGSCASDCNPDTSAGFFEAFQNMANIGTSVSKDENKKFILHTPLINMHKKEIIKTGTELSVDYSLSFTCYSPNESGISCGLCDACRLRLEGFRKNNLKDPLVYQNA